MVPSVGQQQFIYRLLPSNHLPLEQKSTEVVWNFNFITEYENIPDKLKLNPLVSMFMCAYTCAFLLTCIFIDTSFLQTSFTPAILRPRINQATLCRHQ